MCAVLTDGTALFTGFNSYKTHTLVSRFSTHPDRIHLHAEMDCIRQALNYFSKKSGVHRNSIINQVDLSEFKLYIARVLADGSPALAKPCSDCQKALKFFGITNVEWTK